tara:strand:+ start:782 stop:973 length:192 start_codon:yes stop_codon:yes gene_type:complete
MVKPELMIIEDIHIIIKDEDSKEDVVPLVDIPFDPETKKAIQKGLQKYQDYLNESKYIKNYVR